MYLDPPSTFTRLYIYTAELRNFNHCLGVFCRIYTSADMCVCISSYIYIYIYIYTHTYIHTYIYILQYFQRHVHIFILPYYDTDVDDVPFKVADFQPAVSP